MTEINVDFDAAMKNADDEAEEFHAKVLKDEVLDGLQQHLEDAMKKRENYFYVFLHNYDHTTPTPHADSAAYQNALEIIMSQPWVSEARFSFDTSSKSLRIDIKDPKTGQKLFPEEEQVSGRGIPIFI